MSQKSSGYERIEGDAYYTPAWVTEALLSVERFDGAVLDPCGGGGHIIDCFPVAFGIDIKPTSTKVAQRDFMEVHPDWQHGARHIVTNPPYGVGGRLAVEFIRKSLEMTERAGGKVAMLLRVDFDSANGRRWIFADHHAFAAKYTLTKRIRWANLEQSKSGPTENHAWFVWDWSKRRDAARSYGYLP